MAKQQVTQQLKKGEAGTEHSLEHTSTFEDNLLPDASEIEKLKALDPTIVEWLKTSASKEQHFRHTAHLQRMELFRCSEKGERTINLLGLILAFIYLMGGMAFSAFIIHSGLKTTGTIFAGVILLSGAALLAGRPLRIISLKQKRPEVQPKKSPK